MLVSSTPLEKIIFMIKNIGAEAISRDGGEGGNRLQTTLVSLASPAVLAWTKIDLFIFGQQLDLNSRDAGSDARSIRPFYFGAEMGVGLCMKTARCMG